MNPMEHPTMKLALDLVAMCRDEKYEEVYTKYYTEESRGVEIFAIDGMDPVTV